MPTGPTSPPGRGVAVREFVLEKGHGRVDYLLFVDGQPAGVIEAKPEGTTLVEVEHQSGKYVDGLPDWIKPPVYPLPFIYESTGTETRFTNGYDPDARSRRVFTFHRPETLAEWARQIAAEPGRADLPRPPADHAGARQPAAVGSAGHGHPQPRGVAARRPAPRAHPDGDRLRARRSPPRTSATG